MIIRKLRDGDFEGMRQLYDYAHTEVKEDPAYGDWVKLKKPSRKDRLVQFGTWLKEITRGNMLFYVAEDKGRIVGFCFIKKIVIPDSELSHVGELGVRVAKEFRGNGIGKRLVEHALRMSKDKFEIVDVEILGINKVSKHLFKTMGFKTWGIAPGFVKRKHNYIDIEHMCIKM